MFSYIIGQLKGYTEEYIVLENNNIGYKIYMPMKDISNLVKDEVYKIYTEFIVREDAVMFYGFMELDDLEMFLSLNSVSGIGPKAALSIISTIGVFELKLAIVGNDINTITKAPGVGKKTASRLILELTDKIDVDALASGKHIKDTTSEENENYEVAIEGLIGLGYSKIDAQRALDGIDTSNMDLSDIVKAALKRM